MTKKPLVQPDLLRKWRVAPNPGSVSLFCHAGAHKNKYRTNIYIFNQQRSFGALTVNRNKPLNERRCRLQLRQTRGQPTTSSGLRTHVIIPPVREHPRIFMLFRARDLNQSQRCV